MIIWFLSQSTVCAPFSLFQFGHALGSHRDGQVKAIHLVAGCQLQQSMCDVPPLLLTTHVKVGVVRCTRYGQLCWMSARHKHLEVENDRLAPGEQAVKLTVRHAVRVFAAGISRNRSTTLMKRIFKCGHRSRRMATAARPSEVGMSPAQAMTASGSSPASFWPNPRYRCPWCNALRPLPW